MARLRKQNFYTYVGISLLENGFSKHFAEFALQIIALKSIEGENDSTILFPQKVFTSQKSRKIKFKYHFRFFEQVEDRLVSIFAAVACILW